METGQKHSENLTATLAKRPSSPVVYPGKSETNQDVTSHNLPLSHCLARIVCAIVFVCASSAQQDALK